jgi:hypothetical protein
MMPTCSEKAVEIFAEGYTCSEAVVMAYGTHLGSMSQKKLKLFR